MPWKLTDDVETYAQHARELLAAPPEQRRRGYGAAVTAACTADGLARGAERMVLFTDLANPTSNYQRIGCRPVSDRRLMRFNPRPP